MTDTLVTLGFYLCGPLCAAAVLLHLVWSNWRWGVVPMPTTPRVADTVMELMREALAGGGNAPRVADLGAGFGALALRLARTFPRTQVHTIEGSRLIYACSRLYAAMGPRSTGVHWTRGDVMEADLRGFDGVYCYLYPGAMRALGDKLLRELPPGAFVISSTFALPGWNPAAVRRATDWQRTPVYLYRLP